MERLTARQVEVLSTIQAEQRRLGVPPTLRELGAALGITSSNGVSDALKMLERKGYLRRMPGSARGIVLLAQGAEPPACLRAAAQAALRALRRGDAAAAQDLLSSALGE